MKRGVQLPCQYNITATLNWPEGTTNPDLDLYVKDETDDVVCWFGNPTSSYLNLNHDACDGCDATPAPPEIITGAFTSGKTFSVWYNEYSDCAPEISPTTATFEINNTGPSDLVVTVAGGSFTLASGESQTVLRTFPSAGYNVGSSQDFLGGAVVTVECVPNTTCNTMVECTFLPEPLYFDGVFQDISFSVMDPSNNTLAVQVTSASGEVVENPLYYAKCSPCSTNACLPKHICINAIDCSPCDVNSQAIYTWNCTTSAWSGPTLMCNGRAYGFAISLTSVHDGVCGVKIITSEDESTGTGTHHGTETTQIIQFVNEGDAFFSTLINSGAGTSGSVFAVGSFLCGACGTLGSPITVLGCGCKQIPQQILMQIHTTGCFDNLGPVTLNYNSCNNTWFASVKINCPGGIFGSGQVGTWAITYVAGNETELGTYGSLDILYYDEHGNPPEEIYEGTNTVKVLSCQPYEAILSDPDQESGPYQLSCPYPGTSDDVNCPYTISFTAAS